MKRILVITPFFYPHIGGSERYMEDLYAYIKEKNKDLAIDVLCYNTNKVKSKQLHRGLNIQRIPCFIILADQFSLPNPIPLLKFLIANRSKYDLIHVSTRFFDSSWWAPIWAKLTNTKIILTDHCASHPISDRAWVRLISKIVDKTIVAATLPLYDKIFVESKKTKEFLKKTFNTLSTLAYPGLSEGLVKAHRGSKERPWRHKNIKVLYVGRLIESKGVNFLFEIAEKNPPVEFIFAGDGPLISSLKQKSRRYPNILVLGKVSRKNVAKLMAQADIFAYPTWHSEGLPLALIEAGQAGLAVIAMDSGTMGELIVNGKTGILVEPKNNQRFEEELLKLVGNKLLRDKLGSNLQGLVTKNFSWEKAAKLILKEL